MNKLTMVLPLAVLLAYCSGPNNTQTTASETETSMEATPGTASNATLANNTATTSDEIYKVNASGTTQADVQRTDHLASSTVIPADPSDPMHQHWQRTNGQYWTWDMDYPGYDRPVAGSYNTAINGNWQLVMTPELASAWKPDNSRSLWLRDGRTYLSASESFNTNTGVGVSGSVAANSSATTGSSVTDVNSINYNAYNGNMYQLPRFNLYLDNGSFTAYTGCNSISGRLQMTGTGLRFLNTAPSTNIECMGGLDDRTLVDLLRRVDAHAYVGDELQLLQGNQVLLRFKKSSAESVVQ